MRGDDVNIDAVSTHRREYAPPALHSGPFPATRGDSILALPRLSVVSIISGIGSSAAGTGPCSLRNGADTGSARRQGLRIPPFCSDHLLKNPVPILTGPWWDPLLLGICCPTFFGIPGSQLHLDRSSAGLRVFARWCSSARFYIVGLILPDTPTLVVRDQLIACPTPLPTDFLLWLLVVLSVVWLYCGVMRIPRALAVRDSESRSMARRYCCRFLAVGLLGFADYRPALRKRGAPKAYATEVLHVGSRPRALAGAARRPFCAAGRLLCQGAAAPLVAADARFSALRFGGAPLKISERDGDVR